MLGDGSQPAVAPKEPTMSDHSTRRSARREEATTLVKSATAKERKELARDRERGEDLLALIERRKSVIVESFYDLGVALRELLRRELFRALGHASFKALLAERQVMSEAQAYKLIALVEHLPREEALRLGQEKAAALVAYAEATPEPDRPAELARADAPIGGKPLSKVSVRDLKAAAVAARGKRPARPATPAARERRQHAAALVKAARAALRRGGITRATVVVKGAQVVATFAASAVERLLEDRG